MLLSPSGWSRFGLLVSRGGCLPSIRGEKQIDIPSFAAAAALFGVPRLKVERRPSWATFIAQELVRKVCPFRV